VRQCVAQRVDERISTVKEAVARDHGTTDTARIIHAARDGRVAQLVVDPRGRTWGRFNAAVDNIQVLPSFAEDSEDLKNLAAVLTLRTGGEVTVAICDQDAGATPLMAQYRY
jgi:hypothetical protein